LLNGTDIGGSPYTSQVAGGAVDLVVAGINHGANAGADVYYSGTVAAAREGALLGLPAIAVSQALRKGVETDWLATEAAARDLIASLAGEKTPAAGFWSVNLPAPLPSEPDRNVHRVGIAAHPIPLVFERDDGDGTAFSFTYGASYWQRDVTGPSDFSTIRDGGIAVTAIPLFGRF
ncbi:MAG: 5'/3'-nucleotidase SurE, partial [Phycisphaerae bacterium]